MMRSMLSIACALSIAIPAFAQQPAAPLQSKPYRIYAITFRGMTDVEKGFQDYFAARKIPVEITFRDLNRDATRMPGFLDEIRRTRPDLVYTWARRSRSESWGRSTKSIRKCTSPTFPWSSRSSRHPYWPRSCPT